MDESALEQFLSNEPLNVNFNKTKFGHFSLFLLFGLFAAFLRMAVIFIDKSQKNPLDYILNGQF